jgi:hypothetical protein
MPGFLRPRAKTNLSTVRVFAVAPIQIETILLVAWIQSPQILNWWTVLDLNVLRQ